MRRRGGKPRGQHAPCETGAQQAPGSTSSQGPFSTGIRSWFRSARILSSRTEFVLTHTRDGGHRRRRSSESPGRLWRTTHSQLNIGTTRRPWRNATVPQTTPPSTAQHRSSTMHRTRLSRAGAFAAATAPAAERQHPADHVHSSRRGRGVQRTDPPSGRGTRSRNHAQQRQPLDRLLVGNDAEATHCRAEHHCHRRRLGHRLLLRFASQLVREKPEPQHGTSPGKNK